MLLGFTKRQEAHFFYAGCILRSKKLPSHPYASMHKVLLPQHFDFRRISLQLVRCLKAEGKPCQKWMVYHLPQHLGAQISFPDFFVPVFMALKRILRIVDVDCIQLFQTYDLVKFLQNPRLNKAAYKINRNKHEKNGEHFIHAAEYVCKCGAYGRVKQFYLFHKIKPP